MCQTKTIIKFIMNTLPPELISQIFEYCNNIKSIVNIGLVSKELNEIKVRCMCLGNIAKFLLNCNSYIDNTTYSDNKKIT